MNKFKKLIKNKKGVSHPLELLFALSIIIVSFSFVFLAVGNMFSSYNEDEFILRAKAIAISEILIKDPGKSASSSLKSHWEIKPETVEVIGLASYEIISDSWDVGVLPIIPDTVINEDPVTEEEMNLGIIDTFTTTIFKYYVVKLVADPIVREKEAITSNVDYGLLDLDKINALSKVPYEDTTDQDGTKTCLGLESYYDFNIIINDEDGVEILKYGKSFDNAETVGIFSRNIRIYNTEEESPTIIAGKLTVYVF